MGAEMNISDWNKWKQVKKSFQHEIASLSLLTTEKQKWARPANS